MLSNSLVDCCKRDDSRSVVVAAVLGWISAATWGLSVDDTDGGEEGGIAVERGGQQK